MKKILIVGGVAGGATAAARLRRLSEDDQKNIVDSIIGQRLSVREAEVLVKNIKDRHISNNKNTNQKNISPRFDIKRFDKLIEIFKNDNIDIRVNKNNIKININSNDDIEKILNYFQKNV